MNKPFIEYALTPKCHFYQIVDKLPNDTVYGEETKTRMLIKSTLSWDELEALLDGLAHVGVVYKRKEM